MLKHHPSGPGTHVISLSTYEEIDEEISSKKAKTEDPKSKEGLVANGTKRKNIHACPVCGKVYKKSNNDDNDWIRCVRFYFFVLTLFHRMIVTDG
jgi:hypothetical protein